MFYNSSNLNSSEWLALVFANRNQSYGAFSLRKQSSFILIKALLMVISLIAFVFVGASIVSWFDENESIKVNQTDQKIIEFTTLIPENKPKLLPNKATELPAQPAKSDAVKVKSVAMSSNIQVMKDNLVTLSPPTSQELEHSIIASTSQDGLIGQLNGVAGTGKEGGVGIGTTGAGGGTEIVDFNAIEIFPEFPGGMKGWAKYIQRNLRYPIMAQEQGIQGTVFLSFVIEKDGSISNAKVLRGIGYGCDAEAVRVIEKSPRWKVGMQNNLPVRVRFNMPINFSISQ